ncbi:outer membrane protein assembly factor BamD [Muricauda sp. DJ-13]|uniref:Outer membrane protein assembly factor BamD n=2 Tax=Croceivirga thetidis TaxID=2721623 RepID=A0ABX1GUZ5_9FLAO|nr:outer membrane protein assembly factor BamD [Croceivirga thetidis]
MFLKMRAITFPILLLLLLLTSCNEYQKVLKNTDVKAKYELAEKYYNEGDYTRAKRLFEQIAPKYAGKPQGERVMFFFANSYYQTKSFYLAGYQFERFIRSYPNSDKLQEASFLEAKSYYQLSPKYSLDQTDTEKALSKLQVFINTYPESEYFEEANALAQELARKKQKKQFEIGKQYAKLGELYLLDFNVAAGTALENFVSENPGTIYKEDALYQRLVALSNLAFNSTYSKKQERVENAMDAYKALLKSYPESEYKKQADNLLKKLQKEVEVKDGITK